MNMSVIGFLNKYLIQFFFFRLAVSHNDDNIQESFGIYFPAIPLTGWNSAESGIPFNIGKYYKLFNL